MDEKTIKNTPTKITAMLVDYDDIQAVFGDDFWNDTENIYCVPVSKIPSELFAELDNNPSFAGWRDENVLFLISEG